MRESTGQRQCWAMIAIALAIHFGVEGLAAACSCGARRSAGRFYAKKEDVLPAGSDGVLWQRGIGEPVLTVERVQRGRLSPVRFTLEEVSRRIYDPDHDYERLVLMKVDRSELKPGARLRFTARLELPGEGQKDEASVELVVSQAELPRRVKVSLEQSAPLTGDIRINGGTACSQLVRAEYRDIRVVFPAEVQRFEEQFVYSTLVDGGRWRPIASVCDEPDDGRSWMGPGRERVFALCELPNRRSDLDLVRGTHRVVIDLLHIASGRRYRSEALSVSFECGLSRTGDERSRRSFPWY